jgi:hypothetical protein
MNELISPRLKRELKGIRQSNPPSGLDAAGHERHGFYHDASVLRHADLLTFIILNQLACVQTHRRVRITISIFQLQAF